MSTTIAIYLGHGEEENASELFTRNLVVAAVVSGIITVFTMLNLEKLSVFLGANNDTLQYVKEYVSGVAPFAVFFIVSYNMEILVKTDGTPILSTIGVILAGVTNLVLDWLFVIIFNWGVRGAAVATGSLSSVFFKRLEKTSCCSNFVCLRKIENLSENHSTWTCR